MDNTVPGCVRQWIMAMLSVLSSITLILISTPIFAVVILPMGIFYFIVQVIITFATTNFCLKLYVNLFLFKF